MINKTILDDNQEWWKNIDSKKHYLIMTNDSDSYYSCKLLNKLFGVEVGGYFDFDTGLYLNKQLTNGKEGIYVDVCVTQGKSFDNHMSSVIEYNKELFSMNREIQKGNQYNKKYNGSTLAILYGLYRDLYPDKIKITDKVLTGILCIDGFYQGIYNNNGRYAEINYNWFNMLGLPELKNITDANNREYFENAIIKFGFNDKIFIEDGYLISMNKFFDLPKIKFELKTPVKKAKKSTYQLKSLLENNLQSVFSGVETYNQYCIINIIM